MKRSEILPAAKALLEQLPGGIPVVIDDYSAAVRQEIADHVLTGHCLVLRPLLSSKVTGQSGERVTSLVNFTVHVRINPERRAEDLNTDDLQDAIIRKLCGTLPFAAKAGTTDRDLSALLPEDTGLKSDALFFHVLVTTV